VEKTKKKITLLLGVLIFLLFAGGFIYAQVQQDLTVTAQVVPATLELSGFTFPNSLVTISNFGTPMGTTTSAADGSFSRTFSPLTPGTYEITIVATDQFGTDTPARTFSFTIQQNQVITYDNIILPPTMYATTPTFDQSQTGIVTAYGAPNKTMYLVVTGSTTQTYQVQTDSSGKAVFNINGGVFSPGTYDIYTYFEVAYPSDTLTIQIDPGPTATPTPLPTATFTPTPTPVEVTGAPGPSATAGPTTPGSTYTPIISPTPSCPLAFNSLCNADGNNNGTIDNNGEWEPIIGGLIDNTLDINDDGKIDALDLSLFVSSISADKSFLNIFHASPIENDGLCITTTANPINLTGIVLMVFGIIIFLMIFRIILHSVIGSSGFSLTQIAGIALLLVSAYLIFQYQNVTNQDLLFTQLTSTRTQEGNLNEPLSYNTYISSEGKSLNTVDLYLSFNANVMKLQTIDLTESFAPIVTKVEYSNKCGKIHIIGGIPKPAAELNHELFVRNAFKVVKLGQDTSLVTFPGTRAFQVDDMKETDQFIPRVENLLFQ
jgi:hypothetical protein